MYLFASSSGVIQNKFTEIDFVVCGRETIVPKILETQTYKLKVGSEPVKITNADEVYFSYSDKSGLKLCYNKTLSLYEDGSLGKELKLNNDIV